MTDKRYLAIQEVLHNIYEKKCVEPEPRMVGGIFKHAVHRFPIKGGITLADLMRQNSLQRNALLEK